jgi:NAD+ synthase
MARKIKLAQMDIETVDKEIQQFIINRLKVFNQKGIVVGLSGGVDSTVAAIEAVKAFQNYQPDFKVKAYILPSQVNSPADEEDGLAVAKKLEIPYEVMSIQEIVDVYKQKGLLACKENNQFHLGNMTSRIRANILHSEASALNYSVIGTGNWDEDWVLGYYTVLGDGAVNMSPLGNLSKRLIQQLARFHGFNKHADREPTAALETGQTDFKDLGYGYDTCEIVGRGIAQGFKREKLIFHHQIVDSVRKDIELYKELFGSYKFNNVEEVVDDILKRHDMALKKAEWISPTICPLSLKYI